jgi:mono/diheme cytochrome c family protein
MLETGRTIYMSTCAPCHGDKGKGDGPASKIFKPPPRDHTDAAYMDTITDEDMAKTIQMGGAIKGKPLMPSHPQIRDEKLTALVAYVRSLSKSAQ